MGDTPRVDYGTYLYQKKCTCPVCDREFQVPAVRNSRVKYASSDTDLRPYYEPVDPLYYDVYVCIHCGYSAMSSYFESITHSQTEMIKKRISSRYKPMNYPEIYSASVAINRYKLALLSAIVKNAHDSEIAYICLKISWLYRDKKDAARELSYTKKALNGFKQAYVKENFPVCKMDESTLSYLIGELLRRVGDYAEAMKYIGGALHDRNASPRLKERAIEIKELIKKEREGLEELESAE